MQHGCRVSLVVKLRVGTEVSKVFLCSCSTLSSSAIPAFLSSTRGRPLFGDRLLVAQGMEVGACAVTLVQERGFLSISCSYSLWQPNAAFLYGWFGWPEYPALSPTDKTFAWIFSPRELPASPLGVKGFCFCSFPRNNGSLPVFRKLLPLTQKQLSFAFIPPWKQNLLLPQWFKGFCFQERRTVEAAEAVFVPQELPLSFPMCLHPKKERPLPVLVLLPPFLRTSGEALEACLFPLPTPSLHTSLPHALACEYRLSPVHTSPRAAF